jgi:sugar (pentulose or hexulose) kinase
VGTSTVKAALVDDSADVIATGDAAQRIWSDVSGRREHDPALTWRAVLRALERLWIAAPSAPEIGAIVITGPRGY